MAASKKDSTSKKVAAATSDHEDAETPENSATPTTTLSLNDISRISGAVDGPLSPDATALEVYQYVRVHTRIIEAAFSTNEQRVLAWKLLLRKHRQIERVMDEVVLGTLTHARWVSKVLRKALPVKAEVKRILAHIGNLSLASLKTTDVRKYIDEMETSFGALDFLGSELPEAVQLESFLEGLPDTVAEKLTLNKTENVEEAASMLHQLATLALRKAKKAQSLAAARTGGQRQNVAPSSTARTTLTDEERARCIAEGRCFYCRKPGHMSANCPVKKPTGSQNGQKLNHIDTAAQENE